MSGRGATVGVANPHPAAIQLLVEGSYMHTVPVARRVPLSALVAFVLLAGALFIATPGASADPSQCSANTVCLWANSDYTGNFSFWAASDRGCHNHEGNPNLRSVWNRTSNTIEIPGRGFRIGPNGRIGWSEAATGVICIS